jgi:hypothetical protein
MRRLLHDAVLTVVVCAVVLTAAAVVFEFRYLWQLFNP